MTANIRESSREPTSVEPTKLFSSIRELITLLGAATGVFAALFYLAGRSYANGYFGAMNIPEYLITLSFQEYATFAWLPVFIYPAVMIAIGGLMWGFLYSIRDIISPLFKRVGEWFNKKFRKIFSKVRLPIISREAHLMFALFWIGVFFLISIWTVTSTLSFVEQFGLMNGKDTLLERSMMVDLITDKPIMSEPTTAETGSEVPYYVYKGFRLLQVNNGKYYLFKEIDSTTCKPRQVYIVNADQFIQVNLLPSTSLKSSCQPNMTQPAYPRK
jgi:hypothetical protein